MGIDILARWKNQSEESQRSQSAAWSSVEGGACGYLREAYHGEPYATVFFCAEAFAAGSANIPAKVLRERLPQALKLVEERYRKLYKESAASIETAKQSYCDFVQLCEEKEIQTGEPVQIVAWF